MNLHRKAGTCPRSREVLVRRVLEEGWKRFEAAAAAHVSVRTVAKWLRRYREEGLAGLEDRSSRPIASPQRTPESVRDRVVALRKQRLTGREISETTGVRRSTVGRILRTVGLQRLSRLEAPEPACRYELAAPGDLLHIDIKKLGRIAPGVIGHRITHDRAMRARKVGWEHVYVCVDDHSRLSYVEPLAREDKETAAGFLARALSWFLEQGIAPRRLLSDNGRVFKSDLVKAVCGRFGVRQRFTRPYRPQTNGKAERFIQTMLREWAYRRPYLSSAKRRRALPRWLHYYNFHRRHSSLGDRPPASRVNNLLSRDI
jgi:transposase InsO family protein